MHDLQAVLTAGRLPQVCCPVWSRQQVGKGVAEHLQRFLSHLWRLEFGKGITAWVQYRFSRCNFSRGMTRHLLGTLLSLTTLHWLSRVPSRVFAPVVQELLVRTVSSHASRLASVRASCMQGPYTSYVPSFRFSPRGRRLRLLLLHGMHVLN